tara:strand:- start:3750 stop:3980 length:231 start_codon:yes stop_codon:yes gene_type:complete
MNKEQIIEVVSEILESKPEKIDVGSPIKDLPNWDSIKNLMILNSIEETESFQFTDDQLEKINSLSDIFEILEVKGD